MRLRVSRVWGADHTAGIVPEDACGARQAAAEDAHTLASAEIDLNGTSIMDSYLAADQRVEACTFLLNNLPETVTGNCWLAVDAEPMEREGIGEIPPGQSLTVMHLHSIEGHLWTVGLQVWHIGSGA